MYTVFIFVHCFTIHIRSVYVVNCEQYTYTYTYVLFLKNKIKVSRNYNK